MNLMTRGLAALVLVSASTAAYALQTGDHAPAFSLPNWAGVPTSLASFLERGPVVVWFPDLLPETETALTNLKPLLVQNQIGLIVIPVDEPSSQGPGNTVPISLKNLFPEVGLLRDADGAVTFGFADEYVPGVAPRKNFYVLDGKGQVQNRGHYPGISAGDLSRMLTPLASKTLPAK